MLLEIKKLFHTHTGRYKSSGPPKPISFLYIPTIPNLRKTGTPSDSQPMAFLFFVSARHLKKGLYTECWGYAQKHFFLIFSDSTHCSPRPSLRIPHRNPVHGRSEGYFLCTPPAHALTPPSPQRPDGSSARREAEGSSRG